MTGETPQTAEARIDTRQLLEIHAFLACQGPEAFQPSVAWFRLMPDARQGALVDWLLDPAHRQEASALLGREWSRVLEGSDRDGFARMGSLLPCLASCDLLLGFRVIRATAESVGPSARRAFGDALLALALSRGTTRRCQGAAPDADRDLLPVLLEAMARLPLDAEGQARRFLALTQDPVDGLGEVLIQGDLFPQDPEALGLILAEGHPRAIEWVLQGTMARPGGRSDLFQACRSLLSRDLEAAIRSLGRAADILSRQTPTMEPLDALLRAALLPALERTPPETLGLLVPDGATLGTLRLISQVVPGLAPDRRRPLCDLLLDRCDQALRMGRVGTAEGSLFVQIVVQAAVLHPDPGQATERVRRMLLDGAACFRVHLFGSERPREDLFDAAMAFEQVVADLEEEFRRRRSLAYSLDSVMPMVRSLAHPPQVTWAE